MERKSVITILAKPDRGDSGHYSEESTLNSNDCVYTSSCHVENKHFEIESEYQNEIIEVQEKQKTNEKDKHISINEETNHQQEVESYEEFLSNLPLPIEEINHKTVRIYYLIFFHFSCNLLEFSNKILLILIKMRKYQM